MLGETSNFQLEKLLRGVKGFKGTFSHDTIPSIKNEECSGIIN
jgi:hypothetical protein